MSSFSTTLGTSLDFTIPLNLKDLQNKSGCDQYAVDEVLPKRILATKVQGKCQSVYLETNHEISMCVCVL